MVRLGDQDSRFRQFRFEGFRPFGVQAHGFGDQGLGAN